MATILRFDASIKPTETSDDLIKASTFSRKVAFTDGKSDAVRPQELLLPTANSTEKRLARWRKVLRALETDSERQAFLQDLQDFYAATSGAGHPKEPLPISDSGFDSQERVNDPMYVDRQHHCFTGAAYDADAESSTGATSRPLPIASLQWRDAEKSYVSRLVARCLGRLRAFNDDAQITKIALQLRSMSEAGRNEDDVRQHDASQQIGGLTMTKFRLETDSFGEVSVPADKLWGAQTQRTLEHFSVGKDLIPREMIAAYAVLKKAAANANYADKRLDDWNHSLIVQVCNEILDGKHGDMFPLHIWMTDIGIQFDMNVNEVISNRCCQLTGLPLGSKKPVHPNDHVNMSQSPCETFPAAMYIATAVNATRRLIPAVESLQDAIATRAQDDTPVIPGLKWSSYVGMIADNLQRIDDALNGIYCLALGGMTADVQIDTTPRFAEAAAREVAKITDLPFVSAPRATVHGAHDVLLQLSATFRMLAFSLHRIGTDIRLLSGGSRTDFADVKRPENERGLSSAPSRTAATQADALTMIAVQVMANDVSVGFVGASGHLKMNAYQPLMISNLIGSITLMADGCRNFRKLLIEGGRSHRKKINGQIDHPQISVTALRPTIGHDKALKIARYAAIHNLTLKAAALQLGFVTGEEFDNIVDPAKTTEAYIVTNQ